MDFDIRIFLKKKVLLLFSLNLGKTAVFFGITYGSATDFRIAEQQTIHQS
jgi:hypothetical protein